MSNQELNVYKAIKEEIELNFDTVNVYMCNSALRAFSVNRISYKPGSKPVLDKILADIEKLIPGYYTVGSYLREIMDEETDVFKPMVANQFRLDFVNKKIKELS